MICVSPFVGSMPVSVYVGMLKSAMSFNSLLLCLYVYERMHTYVHLGRDRGSRGVCEENNVRDMGNAWCFSSC